MKPSLSAIGTQRCGRSGDRMPADGTRTAIAAPAFTNHAPILLLFLTHLTPRNLRLKSFLWIDIIHAMDIKHFDLNLLRVFDALLTERQVTLAGKKLNRSQNTISAALNRLRDAFEDPLFVRNGHLMQPTQ